MEDNGSTTRKALNTTDVALNNCFSNACYADNPKPKQSLVAGDKVALKETEVMKTKQLRHKATRVDAKKFLAKNINHSILGKVQKEKDAMYPNNAQPPSGQAHLEKVRTTCITTPFSTDGTIVQRLIYNSTPYLVLHCTTN